MAKIFLKVTAVLQRLSEYEAVNIKLQVFIVIDTSETVERNVFPWEILWVNLLILIMFLLVKLGIFWIVNMTFVSDLLYTLFFELE